MIQKDEDDLLGPWLAYHGYLFGFHNLYVLDNGSTSRNAAGVLAGYDGRGIHLIPHFLMTEAEYWTHCMAGAQFYLDQQDYLRKHGDVRAASGITALKHFCRYRYREPDPVRSLRSGDAAVASVLGLLFTP